MKKFKHVLIFLLMASVILLCGMLPTIAGLLQDSLDGQSVTYAEMKTVQFSKELTDFEKLSLVRYGDLADVSDEKTHLKETEIQKVAINLLAPYVEAGLIPTDVTEFKFYGKPKLLYNDASSELSGIFWLVDMKSLDGNQTISMCIDDQDKDLMVVSYDCMNNIYHENGFEMDSLLDIFCNIYFSTITVLEEETINGWTEFALDDNSEVSSAATDGGIFNITEKETTKRSSSLNFYWGDTINGSIEMVFSVYERGFYNAFV